MALEFQCCNATLLSLPSNARLFRPSRSSETIAMECESGGTRGEMVGLLESQGGLPKRCRFSALLCRECLACLVYSTVHLCTSGYSSSAVPPDENYFLSTNWKYHPFPWKWWISNGLKIWVYLFHFFWRVGLCCSLLRCFILFIFFFLSRPVWCWNKVIIWIWISNRSFTVFSWFDLICCLGVTLFLLGFAYVCMRLG